MKLFLIAGYARSGKDVLGNILKEDLEKLGYRVCILKITAPLYHYAYDYFNWNGKEEDKPRDFLQQFGIEYLQNQLKMKTFLVDRLKEDIHILEKYFDIGIITDARLEEEIQNLKNTYPKMKCILLKRNLDNQLTKEQKSHITENNLENISYFDFVIENNQIEELRSQAQQFLKEEGFQ